MLWHHSPEHHLVDVLDAALLVGLVPLPEEGGRGDEAGRLRLLHARGQGGAPDPLLGHAGDTRQWLDQGIFINTFSFWKATTAILQSKILREGRFCSLCLNVRLAQIL